MGDHATCDALHSHLAAAPTAAGSCNGVLCLAVETQPSLFQLGGFGGEEIVGVADVGTCTPDYTCHTPVADVLVEVFPVKRHDQVYVSTGAQGKGEVP